VELEEQAGCRCHYLEGVARIDSSLATEEPQDDRGWGADHPSWESRWKSATRVLCSTRRVHGKILVDYLRREASHVEVCVSAFQSPCTRCSEVQCYWAAILIDLSGERETRSGASSSPLCEIRLCPATFVRRSPVLQARAPQTLPGTIFPIPTSPINMCYSGADKSDGRANIYILMRAYPWP
jgi:hypothetical protein